MLIAHKWIRTPAPSYFTKYAICIGDKTICIKFDKTRVILPTESTDIEFRNSSLNWVELSPGEIEKLKIELL